MERYIVEFSLEAASQLEALYDYIAAEAAPLVAKRYTDAIVEYCEGMQTFPQRGTRRDDVRPGLRVTNYRGSAVIAFAVDGGRRCNGRVDHRCVLRRPGR